jgi:hypothetical protein
MAGRIAYYGGIVTNGLVLYLDAGKPDSYDRIGTTWRDISGNGNNGTLTNGPTFNSDNGGSIAFDGNNDYVQLPTKTYTFSGGVTLEMWLNPSRVTDQRLIDWGGTSTDLFLFVTLANTRIGAFVGNNQPASELNGVIANQWQQYVFIANGVNHIFYRNGILNRTFSGPGFSDLPTSISRSPRIATNQGAGEALQGNIAITRVYSRPLSATEILQNYNANKSRFGLP